MTSHELGGCISYVVSRSGKVLDSTGRVLQEMVPANVHDLSHAEPLASLRGQPESFFGLAALLLTPEGTMPNTRKRKFESRKPAEKKQRTLVWEDDISSSVDDIARAILRRQRKVFGRRKRCSENNSDRHHRLVQHLRTGISQMAILQRWQPGSRELSAKWASWLLKMLRKTKPPPQALQRFLFTVLVAVLPVICCGLVCQTLSILPDSEVLRAVDILCSALERSWYCFSAFQWEILEERIYQCRQVRMKAGTWVERKGGGAQTGFPQLSLDVAGGGKQRNKVDCQSLSSSSDEYAVYNDERMSNELVLSEGVKSLVRRALRERQIFALKRSQASCITDGGTAVSLVCSLSKMRLKIPARGVSCTHLTCFDLEFFLEMNAELVRDDHQTSIWRCPYCGSDASWPQLIVDGFILRILKSLSGDVLEALVWPDGRWSAKEPSTLLSVEDEVRQSESDEEAALSTGEGARNVKPRLAARSDESGDEEEISPGNGNRDGELSGNEASGVRLAPAPPVAADVVKPESNVADAKTQVLSDHHVVTAATAASISNVPVLHKINLQGLIQHTLDKAKCSSVDHKLELHETLETDLRKELLIVSAGRRYT